MQFDRAFVIFALFAALTLHAQDSEKESERKRPRAEDISTDSLISQPGPAFRVPQSKIGKHTKVIVFGDQRFTDPANTTAMLKTTMSSIGPRRRYGEMNI